MSTIRSHSASSNVATSPAPETPAALTSTVGGPTWATAAADGLDDGRLVPDVERPEAFQRVAVGRVLQVEAGDGRPLVGEAPRAGGADAGAGAGDEGDLAGQASVGHLTTFLRR